MTRQNLSSGSYLEPVIGFSRAARIGNIIAIGGTAFIAAEGRTACPGDAHGQMLRCLEIALDVLARAGGRPDDVIRSRIILTDIADWRDAARAHDAVFGEIRPVTTVMAVSRFVDRDWLVEVELDAVIERDAA